MIVSGGHTDVYVVHEPGEYTLLGRTRDDAAGEAFDKVAKMLGLPYPGGVEIDRLAATGDRERHDFPRPMWTKKNFDFSFSGLKTAVLYSVEASGMPQGQDLSDLCASFQASVVDVLVYKALAAAKKHNTRQIVFSGGVACNSAPREHATADAHAKGLDAIFAPPQLCTDNAAMLGPIADLYLRDMSGFDAFTLRANANLRFGKSARVASATPDKHR
jgi:N6-L-threonylcarbamoyladenine synthase